MNRIGFQTWDVPSLSYPQEAGRAAVSVCYNDQQRHRLRSAFQYNMPNQTKSNRFRTGVSLEPEVTVYLDDLAHRMGMSRSWVLNTIVHEYAVLMEKKNLPPLSMRDRIIRL